MNPDEFRTSPGGRVIQVGQGETAYWAFVPNPLPPTLTFDSTLIRLLSDAGFVPPPVEERHTALDDFEKYLHAEEEHPPLVRLALIHYQFEAFHPFVDGNGRIGRLLLSLLLVSWDLLPLPLLYLSAFFEKHRQAYYDLLMAVSARGAWREGIAFFLRGAAEQARDAVVRPKRLQDLQLAWRTKYQRARGAGLLLGIGEALFAIPVLTPRQVARQLRVSHPAAMQALRRLEQDQILKEISGKQRNRLYVAPEIIQVLE